MLSLNFCLKLVLKVGHLSLRYLQVFIAGKLPNFSQLVIIILWDPIATWKRFSFNLSLVITFIPGELTWLFSASMSVLKNEKHVHFEGQIQKCKKNNSVCAQEYARPCHLRIDNC